MQKIRKMKHIITALLLLAGSSSLMAQSLKKPTVPEPSIMKIKKVKSYSSYGSNYMGLWDWNFAGAYVSKTATPIESYPVGAHEQSTTGQYVMFQLQESIISNYIWAKSYKRDKRVKFGLQNVYEPGIRWGQAAHDSSDYSSTTTLPPSVAKIFFNYQFGLAFAVRITSQVDVGFTYYPYVYSKLTPGVQEYSKLRLRYSHFMAEYSFGDKTALEFKYLRGKKIYFGASYTTSAKNFTNPYYYGYGTTNSSTGLYQLSIGRAF
jgi:hypothetical protein